MTEKDGSPARDDYARSLLADVSYAGIYEGLVDGFVIADLAGRIVVGNEAFRSMLGFGADELRDLCYEDITPRRWHEAEARILREQVLARGFSDTYEKEYRSKSGRVFPVELRTCLLRDGEGRPKGTWAIVRDITARKKIEERLSESEERFRGVFEGAAIGMALADPSGRLLRANAALVAMLGYGEAELAWMSFVDLTHFEDRQLDWDLHLELIGGKRDSFQIEKRYVRKDGTVIWGRLTTSALRGHGKAGRGLVLGMVEDITEKKEQEARVERSLNEKAVLLKEVHHRVKNNLQLVASMLALQMSYLPKGAEGDGVRAILAEAAGRVRSMASIHEIVYSTRDFTGLDFSVYMETIARELGVELASEPLLLDFQLQPVKMDIDIAIPCGLLVNEALTNIVKHAYPRDWVGERRVRLRLEPREGGIARIEIRDEGVGLPERGTTGALGFTLMRALASQVGGRLTLRSSGGTIVELEL